MKEIITMLLSSAVGTAGFCILFRADLRRMPLSVLGGVLTCAIYLLLNRFWDNLFLVCMCSSMFAMLYAEILARLRKTPSTVYLIPAIITLIPGGALYYTMQNLVMWDAERFIHYGLYTVQTGLGIAVGIIAVAAIFSVINAAFRKFKV